MPILFLIIAVLLIATAVKGNQAAVATQLETDFTGSNSFFVWIGAILVLAVIGEVTELTKTFKALIALIVVVYAVANNGIFAQFQQALENVQAPNKTSAQNVGNTNDVPVANATSNSSSSTASSAIGAVSNAMGIPQMPSSIFGLPSFIGGF